MSIKLIGVRRVIKRLGRVEANVLKNVRKAALDSAQQVERQAKLNINVLSGRTRSGITSRISRESPNEVVSEVRASGAAAPLELGHKQTPGRFIPRIQRRLVATFVKAKPFLLPAFQSSFGRTKKIFRSVKVGR